MCCRAHRSALVGVYCVLSWWWNIVSASQHTHNNSYGKRNNSIGTSWHVAAHATQSFQHQRQTHSHLHQCARSHNPYNACIKFNIKRMERIVAHLDKTLMAFYIRSTHTYTTHTHSETLGILLARISGSGSNAKRRFA